ncbi:HyaD/HybD family hydrogenase maturation endopeptidase [Enterobacillus tribolii]|uniref:Hydrogenase 2 maturation peptidase n=1 Tax=Enterobacillus tribolii TaxID=1487935 RepID=A0A370R2F9_9GAMM|nr:HyaD/HybD family hydrogenase maturation endopeptidase [Enterobacillus tribolii]MBW7983674.1 HyaD/HybD family hydrogenase maturation endopeptidase [Enterobacillus tribolii]RDK96603.1 hydrogenase 2 maturation peptidase [Enterobacillus tribolii]
MNILILGIGNLLLSDEAVGVRIVERLQQDYRFPAGVTLLDGGTAGMELMDDMANRDHIIVADAVLSGNSPGTVITLEDDEVPALFSRKISPHQLGLSDVLSALRLTGESPARLTLIGVEPLSLEPHVGLTPVVSAAVPVAMGHIINLMRQLGCQVGHKEVSHG